MRHFLLITACTLLLGIASDTAFSQVSGRLDTTPAADRPILGLQVGPLRTRNYRLLGISTERGVIVEDVIPGTPAERYGIPRGAILIGLNGMRIDHVQDVMVMMSRVPVDRPVELTYVVGGRAYRQSIPLLEAAPAAGIVREEFAERSPLPLPPPPVPEPAPAKPSPEAELRLPPATGVAKVPVDDDRVRAMQAELDELRRRAASIEASLLELRDAE